MNNNVNNEAHMEQNHVAYNYIEEITAQYKNDSTDNYSIINYAKNEVKAGRLTIKQVKVWVRDNQELLDKALEFDKEDLKTTLQKDAKIRWYILAKNLCIKILDYKQMAQERWHKDMKRTDLYQRYIDTKDPQVYTELKERIRRMRFKASRFIREAEMNIMINKATAGGYWKINPMTWEQLILQSLMFDYLKELRSK